MSTIAAAPPLLTAIGHDTPRVDAVAKVTGEAQFAGDLRLHGMAHGRLLRSPYAHARITDVDTSRAEALPGVIAVMTGRDLPAADPFYGHALKDRPILAIDRVRFVGPLFSTSSWPGVPRGCRAFLRPDHSNISSNL